MMSLGSNVRNGNKEYLRSGPLQGVHQLHFGDGPGTRCLRHFDYDLCQRKDFGLAPKGVVGVSYCL